MITVTEAKKLLSEHSKKGKISQVKLNESLGLVLAEDISSPMDVPSFDNSAMDGYAVQFDENVQEWEIETEIQAGDTSQKEISTNKAARIFTGAKMPKGADTVIPQELVETSGKNKISYSQDKIKTGSNVRLQGSQCNKGDLILERGQRVGAAQIGLLASVGVARLKVYLPSKVAYIVTGDELKEVGEPLTEGEIYNSNGPMLKALLSETGIQNCSEFSTKDNKESLQRAVNKALEEYDVLILSGGISVGDYDFVKECLEFAGVNELFYKVKQRPGRPMYAGKKDDKWVFALPGNPASAHNCFVQYVRPCLKRIMGQDIAFKSEKLLPLLEDTKKKFGLTFFLKGKKIDGKVKVLSGQQSFNMQAFITADCLVELPEETDLVERGSEVVVYEL